MKTWDWEAVEYVERRAARDAGVNDDMLFVRRTGLNVLRGRGT